jgi:hypothetical protein
MIMVGAVILGVLATRVILTLTAVLVSPLVVGRLARGVESQLGRNPPRA